MFFLLVKRRQIGFMSELYTDMMKSNSTETDTTDIEVLAVSHGGFIRSFLTNFCKDQMENIPRIGNCSYTLLELDYSHYKSDSDDFPVITVSGDININPNVEE